MGLPDRLGSTSAAVVMRDPLRWIAREMDVATTDDRWAIGGTSNVQTYRWVTIVDETILSLTILGALSILGSMFLLEYKGRPATTRMRIVQSLVLSDLILGLIGIIGSSIVLGGTPLRGGTSTCNGLGFCLTAVLWTEHLWTLILAIATYMILIYPLHPITLWLERRWAWLWMLVWVWAIVIGIIGYTLFGYFPSGGICYYGANSGLYGELIQFLPRALVMICITVLYARLFVFLRRPDRIRASFSSSGNADMYETESPSRGKHLFRSRALSNMLRAGRRQTDTKLSRSGSSGNELHPAEPLNEKGARVEMPRRSSQLGFAGFATPTEQLSPGAGGLQPPAHFPIKGSTPPPTPEEPAPWEQVQLPIFHIDGEKFGGRDASTSGASGLHRETSSIWSGWIGLGKGSTGHHHKGHRPSTASSSASPPMASTSRLGSVSTSAGGAGVTGSPRSAAHAFPPTVEVDSPDPAVDTNMNGFWQPGVHLTGNGERHGSISSLARGKMDQRRKASAISAISSRLSEEPFATPSHSGVHLPSLQKADSDETRSASVVPDEKLGAGIPEEGRPHNNRQLSHTSSFLGDPHEVPMRRGDGDEDDEDDEGDAAWDLMTMLQASAPPDGQRSGHGEEHVEFVEESMSSYLNRKTALLMLWFPLGYILLFSVSLIRIIYDFVDVPPIELRALSRWFVFSQGILDAIIYGLVEWHTKRVVRKRVRKGTFNTPAGSRSGRGTGTGSALGALRAMGQGSRNMFTSRNGGVTSTTDAPPSAANGQGVNETRSRQGSVTRSANRTPTASYIPTIPEGRLMEQQLEVEEVDERESARSTGSEWDSVGKGSGTSDLGPVVDVTPTHPSGDGRERERRKEG